MAWECVVGPPKTHKNSTRTVGLARSHPVHLGDALKRNSLFAGRFALTGVALATMLLTSVDALALGLGRLNVQSGLGETLRAEIDITSLTPDEASNLQVKVATADAYRAAGVEYNAVLTGTRVSLERRADGRPFLRVSSDRSVQEPFVDVILEISWSTGRLVREYTMLFDPPVARNTTPSTPAPSTSPSISQARPDAAASTPRAERRAPAAAPRAPAAETPSPAPAPATTEARRPVTPRAPSADAGADEYTVRSGDTLSRIANRTQRPGVSLDQMLVSLYQANPDAFAGNNMNRLKSGAVLAVPSAEAAKAVSAAEARSLIQAQSADFGAYRQRLAGGVQTAKVDGASRQASGQVKAEVDDRKQASAQQPDKLVLSKGSAKASAPEAKIAKDREQKEAAARVAELSRNVEDLKKLSGTKAGGAAAAASKPGVAVTTPTPTPTVPTPAPAPAPAPTPAPEPAPAPTPAPTPAPAPAPAPVASAVTPEVAVVPEVASAPEAASAPEVVASAPEVVASAPRAPLPPPPAPVEEPSIFEENPLVLALGALLVILLIGYGAYTLRSRKKKDSGETSFLESRLQPDSFFGASGGQRIDTRDASGASSSMSYSLSQLDAIGDVDPVAEADVYLAYGRDLQAEEILKEAMRASPERLAIRTKLLEVYAKRRDTKGFELLATQLYGLTGGQGEDWAKAQELGQQIEPDNALYQPGGAPAQAEGDGRPSAELLGASTMPQSVLPSPSEFGASTGAGASGFDSTGSGVDLDLDLGFDAPAPTPPAPTRLTEQTQPFPAASQDDVNAMNFSLDEPTLPATRVQPKAAPAPTANSGPMDFDLSSISLDLGGPADEGTRPSAPVAPATPDFADIDLGEVAGGEDGDPIARKLELAEEFRQIGDMEGARDLLQEVVAKATGSVKLRAQAMLDELG